MNKRAGALRDVASMIYLGQKSYAEQQKLRTEFIPLYPETKEEARTGTPRMRRESRLRRFFRHFFLLLFAWHLGSITLFHHMHVINGVIIVHSHVNAGDHLHSTGNLESIFFLSTILTFGDFQPSILPEPLPSQAKERPTTTLSCMCMRNDAEAISPRAPPVLL